MTTEPPAFSLEGPPPSGDLTSAVAREPQILRLQGAAEGLVKCARCGATDIQYSVAAHALVCGNCRSQWNEPLLESEVDLTRGIADLRGAVLSHTASDLVADQSVVTLKCTACGAEVVISAAESVQTRCHWCRNFLSAGSRIPNGAVPDGVLPFVVSKEDAVETIRAFVRDRTFFAHPKFLAEFAPENVVGVYLPYFVFDGGTRASLSGQGEVELRRWTEKRGDKETRYYSADVYDVARSFTMTVDDLLLESSAERADLTDPSQTNNIVNAILPFDVKQVVRYNANYLRGFTSERRDVNVSELDAVVKDRLLTLARSQADGLTTRYDRGVRWDSEDVTLVGSRWVTVYLPIWLYSYYQPDKRVKHFVAVNGQNKEVMGSIPLNMAKLMAMTALVFVVGLVVSLIVLSVLG